MQKILPFLFILLFSLNGCSDVEPVDPQILAPVTDPENPGPDPTLESLVVQKNSELYYLIVRATQNTGNSLSDIQCINFIYPLEITEYDEDLFELQTEIILNDSAFYNHLLSLEPGQAIGLNYPITVQNENGEALSFADNEELKNAMKQCSQDNIVSVCSGGFCQSPTCYWRVPYKEGRDNEYSGGVFTVNTDNSLVFNYAGEDYPGNWLFIHTEDQLHIVISLEGTSPVANYWNIDSKIIYSETQIEILTQPNAIRLEKYCSVNNAYSIGSVGPANGIVFYDKGSYSNGWRYMEASTQDLSNAQWGCSSTLIGITNTDIGAGMQNSAAITFTHDNLDNFYGNPAACNSSNNGTVAAKGTLAYNTTLASDWFLPSEAELNLMYQNLHLAGLGNFADTNYWSSNETDATQATSINFATGVVSAQPKVPTATIKTRAVRYF